MNKIEWCKQQKKGIALIEPNNNLAQEYMKNADQDLESMISTRGKWKNITAYYACYEALYAILQKIGIKCEIHDCSIAIMNFINGFSHNDMEFLTNLKKQRIDVQYYLIAPRDIDEIKVKEFVLKCKTILADMHEDKIKRITSLIHNPPSSKGSFKLTK